MAVSSDSMLQVSSDSIISRVDGNLRGAVRVDGGLGQKEIGSSLGILRARDKANAEKALPRIIVERITPQTESTSSKKPPPPKKNQTVSGQSGG